MIALLISLWSGLAAAQVLPTCPAGSAPMDMVIVSQVTDQARYVQYRAKLAQSGLIQAFGGTVLSVATRLAATPEMLEGSWPENRHVFVIRWPCSAAAKAFWDSPGYKTDVLPLRTGAGTFDVALYPARP